MCVECVKIFVLFLFFSFLLAMSEVALCVHVGLNLYASCVVVLNFVSQAFDTHNNKKQTQKAGVRMKKKNGDHMV